MFRQVVDENLQAILTNDESDDTAPPLREAGTPRIVLAIPIFGNEPRSCVAEMLTVANGSFCRALTPGLLRYDGGVSVALFEHAGGGRQGGGRDGGGGGAVDTSGPVTDVDLDDGLLFDDEFLEEGLRSLDHLEASKEDAGETTAFLSEDLAIAARTDVSPSRRTSTATASSSSLLSSSSSSSSISSSFSYGNDKGKPPLGLSMDVTPGSLARKKNTQEEQQRESH